MNRKIVAIISLATTAGLATLACSLVLRGSPDEPTADTAPHDPWALGGQQWNHAGPQRAATDGRPIEFRIGVNIGDVIVQDDDVFGDGVNIAARLEGLAEPGGVCVSGGVHDQIQGKLDIAVGDFGTQTTKNITGKMQSTSGMVSFTGNSCAISSARSIRFARIPSE